MSTFSNHGVYFLNTIIRQKEKNIINNLDDKKNSIFVVIIFIVTSRNPSNSHIYCKFLKNRRKQKKKNVGNAGMKLK